MSYGNISRVVAIIPARIASERFPGKVLAPLAGKPLVWHAYQRTVQASLVDEALVATDDASVAEAMAALDVPVVMTLPEHPTGTDRIAEVASTLDAEFIVNVQGDEALIHPDTIDAAIHALQRDEVAEMSTVCHRLDDPAMVADPNVVKVVRGKDHQALYFSRSVIPYDRGGDGPSPVYWQHVGLYVYRRAFLLQFAGWEPTALERAERLEQLRALEMGARIVVAETPHESIGVDTPADLDEVARRLEADASAGTG